MEVYSKRKQLEAKVATGDVAERQPRFQTPVQLTVTCSTTHTAICCLQYRELNRGLGTLGEVPGNECTKYLALFPPCAHPLASFPGRSHLPIVVTHKLCVDQPRVYRTTKCIDTVFRMTHFQVLGQNITRRTLRFFVRHHPPTVYPHVYLTSRT